MPNHKSEDEIVTGSGPAALPPAKPLTTSQLLALLAYTCQELEQERAARKTAEDKSAELKEEIRLMIEAQRCSQDEPRFGGLKAPMDSKKSIAITQQNIKDQLDAVKLLADDFLSLIWPEKGAEPLTVTRSENEADPTVRTPFEQHCFAKRTRFERHCLAMETAGALSPAAVLNLFEKLEERAIYEINTCALLAQSHDPDGIASQRLNVPAIVLSGTHILHQYLPKAAQSKLNSDAASLPRPRKRHRDRPRIINELKKRLKADPKYLIGNKSQFINAMHNKYPKVEGKNTISRWIKEHLAIKQSLVAR